MVDEVEVESSGYDGSDAPPVETEVEVETDVCVESRGWPAVEEVAEVGENKPRGDGVDIA